MTLFLLLNPRYTSTASTIQKFSTVVTEGLNALLAETIYKSKSTNQMEITNSESVIKIRKTDNFDTSGGD